MPAAAWSSSPCLEQGSRLLPAAHGVLLGPVVPGAAGVRHGAVPAGVHVIVVVAGGEGGEEAVEDGAGEEVERLDETRRLIRQRKGKLIGLDAAEHQRLDRAAYLPGVAFEE